ncbi:HepT-like ribonuclease domain-containing protein [Acidithiobacillus sp.]|uniref:HepT-like ribonuclease domain-containing protein n=1 Tax=Acidithiobacillus sp. TaxID=1872118 RepID=UPI003433496A
MRPSLAFELRRNAATKAMNIYPEFAEDHSKIPWRGMHNRIAHGYFDIHLDVVWDTVQGALKTGAQNKE